MVRRPAAILIAGLVLAACSSAPHAGAPHPTSTPVRAATSPAPLDLPTTASTISLVDTSRPVVLDGEQLTATRSLPTTIVRPATKGPWPLVVFVHGYGVGPATYQRYLDQLAARGFVVAAPSFPLEDPARGFPLDRSHLADEAADVSFVISQIEADATHHDVIPGRVGVVGHSDGADVALLVGYDATLSDRRLQAVVADAPDPITGAVIDGGPPLLLVQGTNDEIVDPSSARTVMGQLSAQRWLVELDGASHAGPIIGPSPWTASFDAATNAFLVATLDRTGTSSLKATLGRLSGTKVEAKLGP